MVYLSSFRRRFVFVVLERAWLLSRQPRDTARRV